MSTRKNNRPDLPKLLTARQFAEKIGRRYKWVLAMLQDDCIPAAQMVGDTWVIPEDAIIRPRNVGDLPNIALDVDLPIEFFGGMPKDHKAPDYVPNNNLGVSKRLRLVHIPGLRRVRVEKGISQDTLARRAKSSIRTISKAEKGGPVLPVTALKFAAVLGVDYEELMREERDANI